MTLRSSRKLVSVAVAFLTAGALASISPPTLGATSPDDTPTRVAPKGTAGADDGGEEDEGLAKQRDAYYVTRLLAGDEQLTLDKASQLRSNANVAAGQLKKATQPGPSRGGTWAAMGPNPIVQVVRTSNTFAAMSGRISALAIRNDGTIILGAAQGGVWTYDAGTGTWTPRTQDSDTQSVGALAIAPSNDKVVYMGSGEGALSGDSYFGDGVYRSVDGGVTWANQSHLFQGQSISDIVVDPGNADHLWVSTLRGRGGDHRTTAPASKQYGIWESTDAGASWKLRKGTQNEFAGATDLVGDPQNADVLYASFWGDGIYKSSNGGQSWTKAMTGLPAGQFAAGSTRFSLGISHPAGAAAATLYTGFDYYDPSDKYHPATVWKSVDDGAHWAQTGTGSNDVDSIEDYCTTQCFYDNEVKPDPTDPNVLYVLGSYGYDLSPQSGGVYRSTDGGATWKSLGYDLHPDMHAIAFQPTDTKHVAIGNDGGVWDTHTGGGRNGAGDPLSAADWQDLNGQVNPATGALLHSTGLQIGQFVGVSTVPQVPGQYWGGTQDNGTLRKSTANGRWFDQSSGDGGYALVDKTTRNPINPAAAAYVFGEYYGISPFRYDPSETSTIFGNEYIRGGINMDDRAEFYVPWTENQADPSQLFLGTYRVYRTDNAEAPAAGDVHWSPISGDLTSGCTGTAPNGARGCFISAIGLADGGTGVYAGTDEGWMQVSRDAVTADSPTWTRVGAKTLPNRPVNQIAVDRSDWRVAYAAYGGFGKATPSRTGHVYATTDGGGTWKDISANLPDVPVDTIVLDPSSDSTLYVGTDAGPFVTVDGGTTWERLGDAIPKVAVWSMDYDPSHGVLLAGTHGRGAYTLTNRSALPALVASTATSDAPVGPGRPLDYTVTVKNLGNADATGVTISNPVPAYTSFTSASAGGTLSGGKVSWSGLTVPAGGSVSVTFRVTIAASLPASVTSIVDDGLHVGSAQGVDANGSPNVKAMSAAHSVAVSGSTLEGARVGTAASFAEHLTNRGYQPDAYAVTAPGGSVFAADCTTPLTTTPTVQPGDSTDVCVKVTAPAAAADDSTSATTVTATSTGDGTVSASATLTTVAVASDTALVDEDGDKPDTSATYKAALTSAGATFGYWDLKARPVLPASYLSAHKNVVWFTGNSYPAPLAGYESALKAFLDGGGRLLMSGQDILDQAAGTTPFVRDYLHISWDGTEAQNDKATVSVTSVTGNPVTNGIGTVPLDHSVLSAAFEDRITPLAPATGAFTDTSSATDALTVAAAGYKVEFLAFPLEAYGTAAQKADLVSRTLTWFAAP
ncbi:hypothetical protein [Nocardioides sp. CER19]|uniref:hypothetical protein n=1 Tax=Nocardioides sp. CER19 TaxID=3038538 RepID=UPI002449C38C|nr:hypothetical protein [Nocardioides sp. CER19]MDH2416529.1 hypothetical protein [Nocardioides sp. CER19]